MGYPPLEQRAAAIDGDPIDDDGPESHRECQQLRGERITVLDLRGMVLRGTGRSKGVLPDDLRKAWVLSGRQFEHRLYQRGGDQRMQSVGAQHRDRTVE